MFFQFLRIVLILANSEDPDAMPSYAAFHLGLLFAKVPLMEKGLMKHEGKASCVGHVQNNILIFP